jgi:predicted ribosome quality control (RQC) complex YloA/Tae2 family protein
MEAEKWRQWGEWILAYAHTIKPGQRELAADVGGGEVLVIPLDPGRSAGDVAQAYFRRYRKAQRAAKDGPARLKEVELSLRDLEQLATDLKLAGSRPEIEEVRSAMIEAGYSKAKKRKRAQVARSQPLRLTSPDGHIVLVGRNSRQNDQVTFRQATGSDWWFHASGVPGSHVIVRNQGERHLPDSTIRFAAGLAAFYSQLGGESDVAVDYTLRRHVRRIKGAAPGLVTYTHEQSIRIVPSAQQEGEQDDA